MHLGLGHVAFACAADTTKLATPGTCGCFFAAALLLPNQGQTNALDQPPHKRRGMALAKPPSLFFNVQHVQKLKGIIYICFAQNSRRDILPKYLTIYFAKISGTILCQNIPKGFFAKIFRKIFCQNIPPDILPEYPAKYFARISRKIFWQKIANISHKISCQNSHKDPLETICIALFGSEPESFQG